MNRSQHNTMILIGGWSMVLFALLFVGLTLLIDNMVQAQTMLYSIAEHDLFKVTATSEAVRFLLIVYAILPVLLIPGAVGTYYAFIERHEANMRVSMYFAAMGAICLTFSLLMIPSINWHLTSYINAMPVKDQPTMIIILQAMHNYFGMFIGDLLGFGSLLLWFYITSFVMMRSNVVPHVLGVIEFIIALCATIILFLRFSGLAPTVHVNIQIPTIVALWIFICGVGLISLRSDEE